MGRKEDTKEIHESRDEIKVRGRKRMTGKVWREGKDRKEDLHEEEHRETEIGQQRTIRKS